MKFFISCQVLDLSNVNEAEGKRHCNTKPVLLIRCFLVESHTKCALYMQMQNSLPSEGGKLIFSGVPP